MRFSPLLDKLIEDLCCLPSVGPKSAQRMAFYLLERERDKGLKLSQSIQDALDNIGHCEQCRILSENKICDICESPKRHQNKICVVESPANVLAIEQTYTYSGLYFVLKGHLSPIDGLGPNEIGIDILQKRLANSSIEEIILATNPTVEGEATAHYIAEMAKGLNIKSSRIAHGVPLGSDLDSIDGGTLAHALEGRALL